MNVGGMVVWYLPHRRGRHALVVDLSERRVVRTMHHHHHHSFFVLLVFAVVITRD